MGDPTEIHMVIHGHDGPVTGEHPICGATWEPPPGVGACEQTRRAAEWMACHVRVCRRRLFR